MNPIITQPKHNFAPHRIPMNHTAQLPKKLRLPSYQQGIHSC